MYKVFVADKLAPEGIAALELDNIELEGSDSLDNPNAVFQ